MGHVVEYIEVESKQDIWSEAEEFAYYNVDRDENPTCSYHGNLTIHDITPLPDYDSAEKKINEYIRGSYSDHAVPFYKPIKKAESKKLETILGRVRETEKKKSDFIKKSWVGNRSSNFIGCQHCNSKINRKYISLCDNSCSICHGDLRPASTLERLRQYDNKVKDLYKEYYAAEKRLNSKAKKKVVWLLKVEVHC